MRGGWVACFGLVLLAQYGCSNSDHPKQSNDGIPTGKLITPTLSVKTGEQTRRGRNFNPFLPYYNPDPNQENQIDYARQNPLMNPNAFMPFNPFLQFFNPAMLMMMMQQNPFSPDNFRSPSSVSTVIRTVTSTSVIQSTITETTTQTSITPYIETTTIIIPSTSTSTIVIPVYTTEMFVVTATSTSTIVVPEYSTTTIVAFTRSPEFREHFKLANDEYEAKRSHRQARVPINF